MKIVNLSAKDVVICKEKGRVRFPAQDHQYFSVEKKIEKLNEMNGIPVTDVTYRTLGKLPKPKVGTVYIVPRVVAGRNPSRKDLFIVDGVIERNDDELFCKSLSLY